MTTIGMTCARTAEPMLVVAIPPMMGRFDKGTEVIARWKYGPFSDTRDINIVSNGEWEQHVYFSDEFNKH
jgi:hypothetical protein